MCLVLLFFTLNGCAQNGPLKGSGKIINKTFMLANFSSIHLLDLDGKIEVTVGKPFSITAAIDDNLLPLLDIAVYDGKLEVKLKGNYNNRLYIEATNIDIKICLPQIESVFQRSNGILTVNGIDEKLFNIKNIGNATAYLNGLTDKLEVVCRGNGNVYADKLSAKTITASRSGNGNIYVNELSKVSAQSSGNGDVIVVNRKDGIAKETPSKEPRVLSSIQNLSAATINLSVKYPVKGAYGIDIKPNETVEEYFPIGTKIYKGNQFTAFKTPVIVITKKNRRDLFVVK
jgi:hypothetical protein